MRQMSVLIKPVSGACNLRCKYCFYRDEVANRQTSFGRMTEDTLESVLKNLMSSGAQSYVVGFQGGEPLLAGLPFFEKTVAFVEKYRVPGSAVLYTVQTNGTLIDENWATFFAAHDLLVGLSLDGIKTVHERWRGKNTFDRVTGAAKLLDRYRVPFNIVSVVTEDFARNIEEIYHSFTQHGYRYLQFIPCLDPLGEKAGVHKYSLQCDTYAMFLKKLFDFWWADLERGREVYIRTFNDWIGILKGRQPDCCTQSGICMMQNVIEADGSVFPCDFYALEPYLLGSYTEEPAEALFERGMRSEFVSQSRRQPRRCAACTYASLCRNGCARERLARDEDGAALNRMCEAYREFFAYAWERLQVLARQMEFVSKM